MLDEFVSVGTSRWWTLMVIVWCGRAFDIGSTWLATPNLVLEANPISRKMGWRGAIALNLALTPILACWPLVAISLATTSTLLGARNSQQAWLMRSMGEENYRTWFLERASSAPTWWILTSYLTEAFLTSLVGAALMCFSAWALVPFAIGLGLLGYALVIGVFTTLVLRKHRDPVQHN